MLHYEVRVPLDPRGFQALVHELRENVDLLALGKSLVPWRTKPSKEAVSRVIKSGGKVLPLIYQDNYVRPLIQNLDSIIQRASTKSFSTLADKDVREKYKRTMEVLAGAVYCHTKGRTVPEKVVKVLHCFLAVISNTYRSFLPSDLRYREGFPDLPAGHYPPLATFRNGEVAPSILTSDEIKKLSGGTVGVVVLPAVYMDHPLLWTAVAHEVGGHEMLNAMPGLLTELQKGVRQLFNVGPVQSGDTLNEDQVIGLLWQYWTEETVSDVCGVLNIGPSYGISLAVYQAALYHALAKKYGDVADTLLRLWSGVHPKYAKNVDIMPEMDLHPTDILKIHVIIGAVENLPWLLKAHRDEYVSYLEKLAHISAGGQKEIHVCGLVQAGPDIWYRINTSETGPLPLDKLQDAARRVGAYIATVDLNTFGGRWLQKLETWDEGDEDKAQDIAKTLMKNPNADVSGKGDDAHLLAGATLAFVVNPESYEPLASSLMDALERSYARDPFWGFSALHCLVDYYYPTSKLAGSLEGILECLPSSRSIPHGTRKSKPEKVTPPPPAKPNPKEPVRLAPLWKHKIVGEVEKPSKGKKTDREGPAAEFGFGKARKRDLP